MQMDSKKVFEDSHWFCKTSQPGTHFTQSYPTISISDDSLWRFLMTLRHPSMPTITIKNDLKDAFMEMEKVLVILILEIFLKSELIMYYYILIQMSGIRNY
jgi:hypothetical protein